MLPTEPVPIIKPNASTNLRPSGSYRPQVELPQRLQRLAPTACSGETPWIGAMLSTLLLTPARQPLRHRLVHCHAGVLTLDGQLFVLLGSKFLVEPQDMRCIQNQRWLRRKVRPPTSAQSL